MQLTAYFNTRKITRHTVLKFLLFLGFISFYLIPAAQIRYESGYFITNEGKKVDCVIKNEDWYRNPKSFLYKSGEHVTPETGRLTDIKEFHIVNGPRYIRFLADIDTSGSNLQALSRNRAPEFKQERVFLKVLTDGPVYLYGYTEGNLKRYFFGRADSVVTPLVYKQYMIGDEKISENILYQTQLLQILNEANPSLSKRLATSTRYNEKDLTKLFRQLNGTSGSEYVQKASKKDRFNLTLKAGAQLASLKMQDEIVPNPESLFGTKLGPRLGVEAESVLPFKKNKWSLFAGAFYTTYKSTIRNAGYLEAADYKAINFTFGGRHYFFVNDHSRLFAAGEINLATPINSSIHKERYSRQFDLMGNLSPVLSGGWKNKKYSIELRYAFPVNIIDQLSVGVRYQATALTLGYELF